MLHKRTAFASPNEQPCTFTVGALSDENQETQTAARACYNRPETQSPRVTLPDPRRSSQHECDERTASTLWDFPKKPAKLRIAENHPALSGCSA